MLLILKLVKKRKIFLIIDEIGDPKKAKATNYVARQYLWRLGKIDNGIVAVVSYGLISQGFSGFTHTVYSTKKENNHGRSEIRHHLMLSEIKELIDPDNQWEKLQSIGRIESVRIVKAKTSIETRYYISSLPNDAQKQGESVRSHWKIENYLHWVLDVGFREDDCRIRKDNAPQKFARIRHISLNLLNQEKTSKTGAKNKRLRAGWDDGYLTKILAVSVN